MYSINACLIILLLLSILFIIVVGFCSRSHDTFAHPSGAHMNAAVTFTSCALGHMSWKKFPVYVLGQFLGSFLAAATIYCLFYSECPSLSCLFLASASFSEIWTDSTSVSWTENVWEREPLEALSTPPSYNLISRLQWG